MRTEEFARHNRPPLGLDHGSLPRLQGLFDSWSFALVNLKLPAGFDLRLERRNLRRYRHFKKGDKTTVIYNQRINLRGIYF
ncbi:hypothetical protein BK665_08250 [Pseudomonas frederiksbergensis]|uniref:Uncharacterized protein n=1 Tax=Pseudomonas frederiksbergensis TaxID=104087 RepID=A0A423KNI5_9PSED|nr:hypothetical protein BK665_08250 [Pseudomonas frederiksbergensis]